MDRRVRFIIAEVVFLAVAATTLGILHFPILLPYSWYLFLHIFGVIIFIGNIVMTGAWMAMAERTKDVAVIRFSSSMVSWADVLFTFPGIILIVLAGLTLSTAWGGPFATSWLISASALFVCSGIVAGIFLARYQAKMVKLSANADSSGLPLEYFAVLQRWNFWGIVATILPIAAAAVMVVKPAF